MDYYRTGKNGQQQYYVVMVKETEKHTHTHIPSMVQRETKREMTAATALTTPLCTTITTAFGSNYRLLIVAFASYFLFSSSCSFFSVHSVYLPL